MENSLHICHYDFKEGSGDYAVVVDLSRCSADHNTMVIIIIMML